MTVQVGLASSAFDRGVYAPRVEAAMYHLHRLLAADLNRGGWISKRQHRPFRPGRARGGLRMAVTPSTMPALGTPAPDFNLPDTGGRMVRRDDFRDRPGLLVIFMCNHCPFVQHLRKELARFGSEYQEKGLAVVGISSNDVAGYPDDSPEKMKQEVKSAGYTFPYLFDETQEVATAYRAACTPDFFLYDRDRKLVYRGQFDDSRPGNGIAITGKDLRAAVEALLAGGAVPSDQKPSVGCNIKWKRGNEPDYFN